MTDSHIVTNLIIEGHDLIAQGKLPVGIGVSQSVMDDMIAVYKEMLIYDPKAAGEAWFNGMRLCDSNILIAGEWFFFDTSLTVISHAGYYPRIVMARDALWLEYKNILAAGRRS
jgi:hypothetical protein